MGQRILCYGDSNTYGYDSRSYLGGRYPKDGVSSPMPGSGMWSRAVPNEQKSPSCFVFIYRCQFFSSLKCPVIFSDRLLNFQCRKAPQTSLFAAKMVRPSGFEPLAFRLGGGCSILLSYGRIWNFWCHRRTNCAHLEGRRSILLSCKGG